MREFLTEKQRREISASLSEIRNEIFKVETSMQVVPNDDRVLFMYEELRKRIEFGYFFVKTAKMYKQFEESEGQEIFKE